MMCFRAFPADFRDDKKTRNLRTDRRTDRPTDGQTDERTNPLIEMRRGI